MAFDNDLYVSLACGSSENSWEKNLLIFLTTLLKRLLSRTVKVVSTNNFTSDKEKQEAIATSAVFLSVVTDEYIHSETCMQELILIEKRVHGDFSRIFKVLKTDIAREVQPDLIQNLLSYNFFEKNDEQDDSQTYYESMIYEIERHYWTKLTDLAFDIYKIIDIEKNEKSISGVYIAETSADQYKNRENIIRELKRLGYTIYPDKILSGSPDMLKKEVYTYLQKSFISIHLIGNSYGELLKNSDISAVDLQNVIASDYFEMLQSASEEPVEHTFSRLVWFDPDMKISNEKQKIYIEKLKRDTEMLKGASMIQTPLEHFKSIVISEIKNKKIQTDHSFSRLNQGVKVYLVHESRSFDKISTISANLVRNGFEILHSPLLNEERNLMKKHRQNLIDCDAVLIFYDSNDVFWLKSKINDLIKAPGYGRKRPFAAKAILIDCDNPLPGEFYESKDFIVMHNVCDSSLFALDKFLDKIQMTYV